jgi:hypothetical protein
MSKPRLTIDYRSPENYDREAGFTKPMGWVVLDRGRRLDWPMMETEEEAQAELKDFRRTFHELASDEASERFVHGWHQP